MKPFVIGVAGGSGSGKSTVADRVIAQAGQESVATLALDSYYRPFVELTPDQRSLVDYDHPNAFDWPLLVEHLSQLLAGQAISVPVYDFAAFTRSSAVVSLRPARIIVVEGILVLYLAELRALMDLKVFVDADADVRFIRRLQRDVRDRGRTLDSVVAQYEKTVRPAHLEFVEPSKRYADVIIPRGGHNQPALDMLSAHIKGLAADATD